MSQLSSVLESQRAAERTRALKHLLANPLTMSAAHPEAFQMVVRHRQWLIDWFSQYPSWKLFVEPAAGFARLHKVPAGLSTTRAAHAAGRADFDRRRYTLFCLALAAFDEVGGQTTLMTLAARVEDLSREDTEIAPFDTTSTHERRGFVEALRLLLKLGVLRVREGDAERHALNRDSDAPAGRRSLSWLLSAKAAPSSRSGVTGKSGCFEESSRPLAKR